MILYSYLGMGFFILGSQIRRRLLSIFICWDLRTSLKTVKLSLGDFNGLRIFRECNLLGNACMMLSLAIFNAGIARAACSLVNFDLSW